MPVNNNNFTKSHPSLFANTNSSLKIGDPDSGQNNILADWQRTAGNSNVRIDGKPLSQYLPKDSLKSEDDLRLFFKDIILLKCKVNDGERDGFVNYLMNTFHQGGLFRPVSSALASSLVDKEGQPVAALPGVFDYKINIVTTERGFKVEEICAVQELDIFPGGPFDDLVKAQNSGNPKIKADSGFNYVVFAQGILDIDFLKGKPRSPEIRVEKNVLDFGNSRLSEVCDSRNFLEKIKDFIVNVLNKIGLVESYSLDAKESPSNDDNNKPNLRS